MAMPGPQIGGVSLIFHLTIVLIFWIKNSLCLVLNKAKDFGLLFKKLFVHTAKVPDENSI